MKVKHCIMALASVLLILAACSKESVKTLYSSQETRIESYLRHTTLLGKCTQLVVGKVTRMIAQSATVTMTAHYWHTTHFHSIVE